MNIPAPNVAISEETMLKLARELAMDLRPVEDVLAAHEIDQWQWGLLRRNSYFQSLLKTCAEEWNSATNTQERVRLKSLAFVEEALPEFYARAHDPKENLTAKVEVLKTISRFAGLSDRGAIESGIGERMVVTINLGSDHQIKFEKDVRSTAPVIEGDVL